MAHDELIDAIAATQHGVAARQHLLAAGVPWHVIDRRVASGYLVIVHRGVYLLRSRPLTYEARIMAAVLAGGPSAVASHRTAAVLHGLLPGTPVVEITTNPLRAPHLDGVVVHRCEVASGDTERRDGIPQTRVARTLVDLAAVASLPILGQALDTALKRRLVTCEYLRRRLDQLGRRGRKGVGALATLIDQRPHGRPQAESVFERRLLALLVEAGLPRPVPQFEVELPDGRRARLDFAYPGHLLAIEADSFLHHSSRGDWERDRVRNRALAVLGWRIVPVTWGDLAQPALLLDLLARGLCIRPRVTLSIARTSPA